MRSDGHASVAPAEVRGTPLARHGIGEYDGGRAFAIVEANGWPRLWGYAVRAVMGGLAASFADLKDKRREMEGDDILLAATKAARAALVTSCNSLVERQVPDASMTAVLLHRGELHVMRVGPGRVYVHRDGQPQRLTPRDDNDAGLIDGQTTLARLALDAGDLVLAGTASAFSTRSVGRVASVLQSDPDVPPAVLASLLTDPARKAGVGAGALALRIR